MHREQKVALGLALFAIIYMVAAWRLPRFQLGTAVVDAHLFPLILGLALLALSLLYLLQSGRLPEARPLLEGVQKGRLLQLMASTLVYALLLSSLGFVVATCLFLTVNMYVLGRRGWGRLIATAAGFSLVVYGLFAYGLKVPLARGFLPF